MNAFRLLLAATVAALLLAQPLSAASLPSVVIRDDDTTQEASLDFDYSDDFARKELVVGPTDLVGATSATLTIRAMGQQCGGNWTSGIQGIKANGYFITSFDPCTKWPWTTFADTGFDIPIAKLVSGTNRFEMLDSGVSWADAGTYLAVDTTTDHAHSTAIRNNGPDMHGELMWSLTIRKDTLPGRTHTVRDDDGAANDWLDFDYSDDTATKDLLLGASDVAGATSAQLDVYGYAQECAGAAGTQTLYVNGVATTTFDPCALFGVSGPVWVAFPVPLALLTTGSNHFQMLDSGATWIDHGSVFGIDTDNDHGRSVAIRNGVSHPGELMWDLEFS